MSKTRMTQIIIARKIGTHLTKLSRETIALPSVWLLTTAMDMLHQVKTAFIVAASNQAPKRYQTSSGSLLPVSGVNIRATPATSIPQKA